MSNKNYYRWGDQELILVPVDETTIVEIGDFMVRAITADYNDDNDITANNCCPVTYMVTGGTAAIDREKAADQFLGIAMTASLNGQTANIIIATAGIWELVQKAAAAIHVGDPIEVYSGGTNCEDQTVVEGVNSPIAVCWEHKSSTSLTGVMAKLLPSKLLGAVQETLLGTT